MIQNKRAALRGQLRSSLLDFDAAVHFVLFVDLGQNQPENAVSVFGCDVVLIDLCQRKGTLSAPAAALVVDVRAPGCVVRFAAFAADGQHTLVHVDVNLIARAAGQLGLDQEMIALVAHVDAERFGPRFAASQRVPEKKLSFQPSCSGRLERFGSNTESSP